MILFVQAYYTEILAVLPVSLLLAGLVATVGIDPYIQKRQRRRMLTLCGLALSLIIQNFLENLLCVGRPMIPARTIVATCGYCIRPAILLLFLMIVSPGRSHRAARVLTAANALVYLISIPTGICFRIDAENHFQRGMWGLGYSCLIVSLILLVALFRESVRGFRASGKRETWIPILVTLMIPLALLLDDNVYSTPQPVSFLTIVIVIGCALYYNWLHLRFVREHEAAMAAGRQLQLSLSQIKPHFLYNSLNAIEALCDEDPQLAKAATNMFSRYLRGNMDSIGAKGPIPFQRELEHTKIYLEIEKLRFEEALQVRYDIACADFLIPALTVEPLAENAVRHGVRKNRGGRGTVSIAARAMPDRFEVVVEDDGPGFDPSQVPADGETHVGIANVRERLASVCGGALEIRSEPGRGTRATIILPREQEARAC